MISAKSISARSKKSMAKTLLISFFCVVAFVVFFIESPIIIERMKSGLNICAKTIIPSLFPYMVLSEVLISSGLDRLFDKTVGGAFEKIFKLPRRASSAFFLGLLCGFPVGTKISYSLYEKGKITNSELFHLLLISNIQSSAFIINTVGISLLGSKNAGVILYLSQIIALTVIGILYPRFYPTGSDPSIIQIKEIRQERKGIALTFTSSVKSSTLGILIICGFVLFFYVLCGIMLDLGEKLGDLSIIALAISSMLEMSCGCIETAGALTSKYALLACSMILGFSGISLHFQIMSLCPDAKIKYGRFFVFKILSSIIAGICTVLLNLIFNIFA